MNKPRDIFPEIERHIFKKEFTIITGARQTGKTTLLKQVFNKLQGQNQKVWYITFEREDILKQINADPENIFQYSLRPPNTFEKNDSDRFYLLIDEIQYAQNPSNFLKYLYDTYSPNLKIIATGSSSFYIDKKFTDSLAGRKKIFRLNTLNFNEFLHFKEQDSLQKELKLIRTVKDYRSLKNNKIIQLFSEYLIFGGYPDVVLADNMQDKLDKLFELKNSFIKRDILESNVENEQLFYNLLTLLAAQTGNLLNKNSLSKTLKCDKSTIDRYIYILQKCFYINIVPPFYKNIKKEIVKMPKVYLSDLGMKNLLINNFMNMNLRQDRGELLENYVYIRLRELYYEDSLHFWRTTGQNEIDFVVNDPIKGKNAFEVKFSTDNVHLTKYKIFKEAYPDYPIQFVGFDYSDNKDSIPVLKL